MATSTQDEAESVDLRRSQLKYEVIQLQKALSYWTTLGAEYQMLKTRLESAGHPSALRIQEIAQSLHSSLIDEQEIEKLLGKDLQIKRNARSIVHLLSKRIEYVQRSISSAEKQLNIAEKRLVDLEISLEPGMENEDGLPMMDIEEELDENENEISSSITRAGEGVINMIEALDKVGKDVVLEKDERGTRKREQHINIAAKPDPALGKETPSISHDNGDMPDLPNSATKIIELKGDEKATASLPVIPEDESQEDAELRKQMLQYSLMEVGQVVAELDLDYPTASYSDDEDREECDDDDDDDEYDSADHEDLEDEYGRSLESVLTEGYRRQMMELEHRLNVRALKNTYPQLDSPKSAEHNHDSATSCVRENGQSKFSPHRVVTKTSSASSRVDLKRKSVRFVDSDRAALEQSSVSPVSQIEPRKIPSGPLGRTLASTITEHTSSNSKPLAPDEFDPLAMRRELDVEYHKARQKYIQRQRDFSVIDDDKKGLTLRERDGQVKKVSRFKAARLGADEG